MMMSGDCGYYKWVDPWGIDGLSRTSGSKDRRIISNSGTLKSSKQGCIRVGTKVNLSSSQTEGSTTPCEKLNVCLTRTEDAQNQRRTRSSSPRTSRSTCVTGLYLLLDFCFYGDQLRPI
ncbi:hypothetical protein AFLA_012477 [Aspergillus flavus NRRL3357]|nr:hypothetical protein AFLA_012477 [Aspergillus flavus NRRL3357]